MIKAELETLRICACCPNPCRRAIPATAPLQLEAHTPSALALLAVLVFEGTVPFTRDIARLLGRLEAAEHCRAACVYGFDIPSLIRRVQVEALR
jgi:hypothetical protein